MEAVNETQEEVMPETREDSDTSLDDSGRPNRVAHIPLGLLEDIMEIGEVWVGEARAVDESRIHMLFKCLAMEWVIVYFNDRKNESLNVRSFDSKEKLQDFLAESYAREVAVDGIEMVLENGRPRRFQIEVKPRIGF